MECCLLGVPSKARAVGFPLPAHIFPICSANIHRLPDLWACVKLVRTPTAVGMHVAPKLWKAHHESICLALVTPFSLHKNQCHPRQPVWRERFISGPPTGTSSCSLTQLGFPHVACGYTVRVPDNSLFHSGSVIFFSSQETSPRRILR